MLARQARDVGHAAGVRVADLAGDLPAVFGLGADPDVGLADWLDAGAEAPTEALDRLLTEVAPGVALLPRGRGPRVPTLLPAPESGAALAVALGLGSSPVLVDCGTAREPAAARSGRGRRRRDRRAARLLPRVAASRARAPLEHTAGVVLLDEPGRSLGASEIGEVLDLPVLARIPVKEAIARAVDAGVLPARLPEPLARAATDVVRRVGVRAGHHGEAA